MAEPKRPLALFVSRISPAKVAEGINAAERNAKRLALDARSLLEAKRFPSSAALAILSIEEAGKGHVLRGLSMAKTEDEAKRIWKEYRSHTRKNVLWILPELIHKGARKLDDFGPLFDPSADHPYILEQIKQLSFYTDCVGKGKWVEPEKVIREEMALSFVKLAEQFASEQFVTAEEIELWVKHMGPVQKSSPAWFKKAFENYYADLQQRGLAPPGENVATQLIEGRISPTSGK